MEFGGPNGHRGRIRRHLAGVAVGLALIASLAAAPSALAATSVTATVAKLGDVGYVVTVNDIAAQPIALLALGAKNGFEPESEGFVESSIVPTSCHYGSPLAGMIGCPGFSSGSLYVCYAGPATTQILVQLAEGGAPVEIAPTKAPEAHSCPVPGFVPPASSPPSKPGKHHKKKHKKKPHHKA